MSEQNIHILIIEDNPGDIGLIREFLNDSGAITFHLSEASTLKVGIAVSKQQSFDIILLDLSLPDSKGLKTLAKVKDACPGKPVIVLTGNIDLALGKKAIGEGAQDYLIKGKIDSDILIRAIEYSIQRFGLESRIIESEAQYHALIDLSPNAIVILDKETIQFINKNISFSSKPYPADS